MIQSKQVEYAKEIDDVMALLVHMLSDIRAGKSAAEIASGNIAPLMEAVAGIDGVSAELAASRKVVPETVGYRVGELTDVLLGV